MSTSRLRGLRLTGVLAGAVAIMTGAQQGLGLIKPPLLAPALVLAAAFFLGMAAGRSARVGKEQDALHEREGLLDALLRRWPMARLDDLDPHALGVFPSDGRPRTELAAPSMFRATSTGRCARRSPSTPSCWSSGRRTSAKSRTALEAAGEVLKDATVLVPEDGEALRQLLELKPWQQEANTPGLLWLDGLERYLPSLDRGSLDRLTRSLPKSKTVATMRESDYQGLLKQSGDFADAGKRILTRARTLRLADEPSEGERERAAKLHPQLDVSAGGHSATRSPPTGGATTCPQPPTAGEQPAHDEPAWHARMGDFDRRVGT